MSARSKGKKLQSNADEITRRAEPGVMTADDNEPTVETAGGIAAKAFPRKFDGGPSKEWVKMTKLKDEMTVDDTTKMTRFGQRVFSDRDAKELLKAEESAKEVAFDSWFAKNWNKADLPTRILAQKLHPEFYAKREQDMMDHAMLVLKIKKLQLRGPRDQEDVQIIYGLQSGDIKLFPGWDTIGYIPDGGEEQSKGLWRSEMLKQGTFWDNANRHAQNATRNATVGGAVGSDPQLFGGNLGNSMLYGSTPTFSGSGTATSNIFSRLF